MSISVGDKLPEAKFLKIGAEGPEMVNLYDVIGGKTVVMFGLPGAYRRTCTAAHMPSFIRTADALREKGVSEIICFAVNDPFVMQSWSEDTGAAEAGIHCLADADGSFTKAIGLDFTADVVGFYGRTQRHAMVVKDGTVSVLNLEADAGVCNTTAGEAILEAL